MKSTYDNDYHPEWTRKLALLDKSITNAKLARAFEIAEITFEQWLKRHKKLRRYLHEGKEMADAEVAHSLFERATGRTKVRAHKIFQYQGSEVIVPYIERYAPDVAAISLWLSNRDKSWKSARGAQEVSGPDGGPVQVKRIEHVIVDPKAKR